MRKNHYRTLLKESGDKILQTEKEGIKVRKKKRSEMEVVRREGRG